MDIYTKIRLNYISLFFRCCKKVIRLHWSVSSRYCTFIKVNGSTYNCNYHNRTKIIIEGLIEILDRRGLSQANTRHNDRLSRSNNFYQIFFKCKFCHPLKNVCSAVIVKKRIQNVRKQLACITETWMGRSKQSVWASGADWWIQLV